MLKRIKQTYYTAKLVVLEEDKWLFNKEEKLKVAESYMAQLGWVQLVEARYSDVLTAAGAVDKRMESQRTYDRNANKMGHNYVF